MGLEVGKDCSVSVSMDGEKWYSITGALSNVSVDHKHDYHDTTFFGTQSTIRTAIPTSEIEVTLTFYNADMKSTTHTFPDALEHDWTCPYCGQYNERWQTFCGYGRKDGCGNFVYSQEYWEKS